VLLKELLLTLQSISNTQISINLSLRSTLDSIVSESQRIYLALQQVQRISARIHQVDLRYHTYCSFSQRVYFTSHLQRIRIGKVSVRSSQCQNQCVTLGNVSICDPLDLVFDVLRLSFDGNLGYSWQINHRQIHHVRRVNSE
jgi:hypothetical protein